ncbi:MAG: M14 family zinc carboxypeptidase [Candidatus Zhuqueibacterota bacterium]
MIKTLRLALLFSLLMVPVSLAQLSSRYFIDYSESGEHLFFHDAGANHIFIDVNPASRDRESIFFISRYADVDTVHFSVSTPWPQPLYSYDKIHWYPIDTGKNADGRFHFQFKFRKDHVYVALNPPPGYERPGAPLVQNLPTFPPYYTYDKIVNYVNSIAGHPFIERVIVGQSIQGRDIFMLTVTDPSIPDSLKKSVWLQFRVHGDEMAQSYIFEGLVNYLLSGDSASVAPQALQRIVFKLIPVINPDGVVNRTRGNSNGVDMNRIWVDSTNHEAEEPEVRLVHDVLDDWILNHGHKVNFALDKHGWGSGHDGGYRTLASVAGNPYVFDQVTFLRHLINYDPWQRWNDWTFSEGAWGMFRLALFRQHGLNILTWETTSGLRYDGSETTIDDLKEEGAAFIDALYRYLFHVYFIDGKKNDVSVYSPGDSVFIRLEEADAANQIEKDKCRVILTSSLNDTETVALSFDPGAPGVYYSPSGLPLSPTTPVPEDGLLQIEPEKPIRVTYQDVDFPGDSCSQDILVSAYSSVAPRHDSPLPQAFALFQNYPNPFNGGTTIQCYIPAWAQPSPFTLAIFNVLGKEVTRLADQTLAPGYHTFRWDGRDANGINVASGLYFYSLSHASQTSVRKLLLIR